VIGVKGDSRLSDLHLGLQVEKGIGELFSLSEGRFDDLRGEMEGYVMRRWSSDEAI